MRANISMCVVEEKLKNKNDVHRYIYLTKNLLNGHDYIGQHTTKNMHDNYKGSGKLLRIAMNKYGKSNFQKTILYELSDFENEKRILNEYEIQFIEMYRLFGKAYYNISNGGSGGNMGEKWKECHRKVIESEKWKENHKKVTESARNKKHSEEWKTNIKLGMKFGKKRVFTEEVLERMRVASTGRKQSDETIRKRVEKLKGHRNWSKPMTDEQKINASIKSAKCLAYNVNTKEILTHLDFRERYNLKFESLHRTLKKRKWALLGWVAIPNYYNDKLKDKKEEILLNLDNYKPIVPKIKDTRKYIIYDCIENKEVRLKEVAEFLGMKDKNNVIERLTSSVFKYKDRFIVKENCNYGKFID